MSNKCDRIDLVIKAKCWLTQWEAASIWGCGCCCISQFSLIGRRLSLPRTDLDQTSFSCSLLVLLIALKQGDRQKELCSTQPKEDVRSSKMLHTASIYKWKAEQGKLTARHLDFNSSNYNECREWIQQLRQSQCLAWQWWMNINIWLKMQGYADNMPLSQQTFWRVVEVLLTMARLVTSQDSKISRPWLQLKQLN